MSSPTRTSSASPRWSSLQPPRRLFPVLLTLSLILLAGCAFYVASPRKTLIRRLLLPGYWRLVLQGKTLYDSDLAILRRGNPDRREIALTIDDGPRPENAGPLLDALKGAGAKATFFVVGKQAKKHPELLRRMIEEGHEIGSHTYHHLRLPALPDRQVRNTLKYADIIVRRAANGYHMRVMRPPGGAIDDRTARIAKEAGYVTVLWSATSGDYETLSPERITRESMDGVENGAILLLHDAHAGTVTALPTLLHQLKESGYRFVTVSEMLDRLPAGLHRASRSSLSHPNSDFAKAMSSAVNRLTLASSEYSAGRQTTPR